MHRVFSKSLAEIERSDLEALIEPTPVFEGLLVEYKRDFPKNDDIGRSVASFSNMDLGGTLVLGIEATKLRPVAVLGLPQAADAEERIVNIVRSTVTPVPSFHPRAVPISDDLMCVVVEVQPGGQPPHIHIPSARIYLRTPTSSEPMRLADRETLDSLFARGREGKEWATRSVDDFRESFDGTPRLVSIPEVRDGLPASPTVFQQSFYQALFDIGRHSYALSKDNQAHDGGHRRGKVYIAIAGHMDDVLTTSVRVDGIVASSWKGPRLGKTESLTSLSREAGPMHRRILEELLDYRGSVTVVTDMNTTDAQPIRVVLPGLAVVDLDDLADKVNRAVSRELGYTAFEP